MPERRASRNSFHANARAANAIAVTEVVGVLVMVGSFLKLSDDGTSVREDRVFGQAETMPLTQIKHPFVAFAPRFSFFAATNVPLATR
jgi:hypothetical protein